MLRGVTFYVPVGPERRELQQTICSHSGTISTHVGPETVILLTPTQIEHLQVHTPVALVSTRVYSTHALTDAIAKGRWHSNKTLEKMYKARIRGIDPNTGKNIQETRNNKRRKKKHPFTPADDGMILLYLRELLKDKPKNEPLSLFGEKLWKQIEQMFVAPKHTWQSMKERYHARLHDISAFERDNLIRLVQEPNDEEGGSQKSKKAAPRNNKRRKVQVISDDEGQQVRSGSGTDSSEDGSSENDESFSSSKKPVERDQSEVIEEEMKHIVEMAKKRQPEITLEEMISSVKIIKSRVDATDAEITHALLVSTGNPELALKYLIALKSGKRDMSLPTWTFEEDQILLSSDEKLIENEIYRKRGRDSVFARMIFLHIDENEEDQESAQKNLLH